MKYKVLIVDDSFSFRNLLKNAIKNSQNVYEVVGEAKNGQEAVDLYKKLNPDIVTMDLSMPVRDGVYATNEILSYNPQAKIIVVTGTTIEELIDSVRELGIKNIVRKPFQNNLLISMMNEMMIDSGGVIEEEKFDIVTPVFTPEPKEGGLKPINPPVKKEVEVPVLKPIIQEPVIQEKPIQKPVVQKPIVQEPVVQKPIVQEPIKLNPVVEVPRTIKDDKIKEVENRINENNKTIEVIEEIVPVSPIQKEEPVYEPIKQTNTQLIENDDDEDDDVYTPPTTNQTEEDDDDVYTPPTEIPSLEQNKLIDFNKEKEIVSERKVEEPIYTPSREIEPIIQEEVIIEKVQEPVQEPINIYTPKAQQYTPVQDTSNEHVSEIIHEEIVQPIVQPTPVVEEEKQIIVEKVIEKQEPIINDELVEEKIANETNAHVYIPMGQEPVNEKVKEKEKEKDSHEVDVYRDVYKPKNDSVTEDIIPLPNLGQNIFTPQYDDKNAFELKGTSEQLKKPVHWEEDKEESVEELTMSLPGQNQQTVKPTPRQEPIVNEREVIQPQQPIPPKPMQSQVPPNNGMNRGTAPKMPEPPKRPVPPNQFGVGRPSPQGPPRPENVPAQPPRPPRGMNNEPMPPMQSGYGRDNHPRNNYGQGQPPNGNYPMQQPPMAPMQGGQPPSNYYERQPQNNQHGGQPPLEQGMYEVSTQETPKEKKKGGIFSFFSGLFSKKK